MTSLFWGLVLSRIFSSFFYFFGGRNERILHWYCRVKIASLYSTVLYCERGTKIDVFYDDALFYYDGIYYLQHNLSFYLDGKFQINVRYKTIFWNT